MAELRIYRNQLQVMMKNAAFGGPSVQVHVADPEYLIKLLEDAENEIASLRNLLFGGKFTRKE